MCKEHFEDVLGLVGMVGTNAPSCVELVAMVRDTDRSVQTIVTNVDIETTIERFRAALKAAEAVKAQLDAGVAHFGDASPTAH